MYMLMTIYNIAIIPLCRPFALTDSVN